jgi:NADPH2:quinone reductase
VNPSDVKSRRNRPLDADRIVPHSDGAGVIDLVGEGVPSSRVGERVWVWNGQWQRPMGTAAEYISLPARQAVPLPATTDFAAAACLGIPALTAFHAIRLLGDLSGKTVLVIGAASAVAHYAVQLAVIGGAEVIGTVSSERAQHALDAGVKATIDYKREPVAQRVRELTGGRGVDAIVDMDFSSTAPMLAEGVLAPHGIHVCYGSNAYGDIPIPFRPLLFSSIALHFFLVYDLKPLDRAIAVDGLTDLLQDGRLRHAVGARFPLEEIVDAHVAVEAGKLIGNVVLELP